MKSLFAMLWLSMLFVGISAEEKRMVARTDFVSSPLWKNQNIQGKEFWTILCVRFGQQGRYWQGILLPGTFRPLGKEVPSIQQLSVLQAFRDSGISVEPAFQNHDFKIMDKYNHGQAFRVKDMLGKEETLTTDSPAKRNQPLIIRDWAPRPFPFKLTGSSYSFDSAECEEWISKHPNFRTFDMGEWDNEYINLYYYLNLYRKLNMISEETAQQIRTDYPEAKTKDEFVARLKKAFERKNSLYFGDPGKLSFMHAGWNLGHLAAYWGCGMITLETSNSGGGETYYRWQVGMSFARGAARQYSIPWMWYIASCLNGYTSDGKWVSSWEPGFDSNNGVGPSWLNRCFYLAYFSGANLMELEHWYLKVLAKDKKTPGNFTLSRIGKKFNDFHNFTAANPERGMAYTPIALLIPFNQGYPQWGGNGYGSAPYTRGDFTLDAFWATIVPSYDRTPALRRGEQGALFNSPYGDLFDVVIPDAPDPKNLDKVLDSYKAAILAGNVKVTSAMTQILAEYVKKGGTLILNVKQLDEVFPSKFAGLKRTSQNVNLSDWPDYTAERVVLCGAEVLTASEKKIPLLTLNHYGKGNVIVSCVDSWVPRLTAESVSHTRRGLLQFPFIQDVLKRLTEETIPFRVEGDIQFGINKTKGGWLIYLINNKGVTKMADTPEKTDPKAAAKIVVRWNNLPVNNVRELLTCETVPVNGNSTAVTVPPGEIRILNFVCR